MSLPDNRALPKPTHRQEMLDTLNGEGPADGEMLIEYGTFLTDAFGTNRGALSGPNATDFIDDPGAPDQIDGFQNDDSYRASRHYIRRQDRTAFNQLAEQSNLRENSLARQLAEKRDQPATIRLIRRRSPEEMTKGGSGEGQLPWENLIPPNTKFFLESVVENREEKVQVMDTFGEFVAFFFGRRPEVYSYQGTLLNAKNHDWKNEFQWNYDYFLRGSQAVKYRATMILQYDDVLVEGYMMSCQTQQTAAQDKAVPFSFNLLVLNRSPINPRNMLGLRFQRSGLTTLEQELFNSLQEALDLTQTGRIDDLSTFLLMREYFVGNYVPAAGNATHQDEAGTITPETSTAPGVMGGTESDRGKSQNFDPANTTAITNSGIPVSELE